MSLELPNVDTELLAPIDQSHILASPTSTHAPRILVLYGSLRQRSFSRLAAQEAARILTRLGAEVRFFNPSGLPLGVLALMPVIGFAAQMV